MEHWIVALGRRRAVWRVEPGAVHEKSPGDRIRRVGQTELPRHVADQLATVWVTGIRATLVRQGLRPNAVILVVRELMEEELARRIPKLFLHATLERRGARRELARRHRVADQRRRASDRDRVG